MNRKTVKLQGFNVDTFDFETAVKYADSISGQVITINPEMINNARKNSDFADIINSAELVIPDGIGVEIGLKILGNSVRRIAGIEFAHKMLEVCAKEGKSVAFVGAKPEIIEKAAENNLPQEALIPQKLHSAMRYSVIGGGKRVRPLLVYAVGQIYDADPENLDLTALAVECVHSYSLIHDDLPCMDNDILRHGKPTTHTAFGEAVAMLAGDALQPEAFLFLVRTKLPAEQRIKLVELLAYASSTRGMCGGQAIDLSVVGNQKMTIEELRLMHSMKTGALLKASVLLGAFAGKKTPSQHDLSQLEVYGNAIGLAFQIVDDILDVVGDTAELGKTAGKDALGDKPTYVSLLGLEKAKELAEEQYLIAAKAVEGLSEDLDGKERLIEIADFIIRRTH